MITVTGNKTQNLKETDFLLFIKNFEKTVLDIGTGDGRFVYESAKKNQKTLFIGMDPAQKQMEIFSRKANRKKLNNCIFLVGSVEKIPNELYSCTDQIFITLPWGTLLEKTIKPGDDFANELNNLLKKDGMVEIILGYDVGLEPSEAKRLNLPNIDEKMILDNVIPALEKHFVVEEMKALDKKELGKVNTTWAKKLKFGRDRLLYKIRIRKKLQ